MATRRGGGGGPEYTKGTTQQVLKKDAAGFPTESIERDTDGRLWHVTQDADPVHLADDDEVRAVAAEAANKGGGGGSGDESGGGGDENR